MKKNFIALLLVLSSVSWRHPTAGAAAPADEAAPGLTQATFSIMGLHCPPCSKTVSSSLARVKGVRSAKVDYQTKSARIEFDESVLSAQDVIQSIAGTPHMMGSGMRYNAALALSVPEMKDADAAAKAKEALAKVQGVTQVSAYPHKRLLVVHFGKQGHVSSRQLIEALGAVDLIAKTY